MATLHILRNLDTALCFEAVASGQGDGLLLVQDAVLYPGPFPCPVQVGADDLKARGITCDHPQLSYDGMRDLMFTYEHVVLW